MSVLGHGMGFWDFHPALFDGLSCWFLLRVGVTRASGRMYTARSSETAPRRERTYLPSSVLPSPSVRIYKGR